MPNLCVLALMPHPDDIEILCAGTLLHLKAAGCDLHFATMTPGDKGSVDLSRNEIANIRREEARCSSGSAGARSYTCLDFSDLEIVFDNQSRSRVVGLLRMIDPDIVFTTPPVDYMFDHEITSKLVRDACFNAAVKNYGADDDFSSISKIPHLYYSDPIGGNDLFGDSIEPHFLVDITSQIDRKAELLAYHDSQRSWLREQHGIDDYIESMRLWARERGAIAGVQYAEGFRQHLGHPYPADNPLARLLGEAVVKRGRVGERETGRRGDGETGRRGEI